MQSGQAGTPGHKDVLGHDAELVSIHGVGEHLCVADIVAAWDVLGDLLDFLTGETPAGERGSCIESDLCRTQMGRGFTSIIVTANLYWKLSW